MAGEEHVALQHQQLAVRERQHLGVEEARCVVDVRELPGPPGLEVHGDEAGHAGGAADVARGVVQRRLEDRDQGLPVGRDRQPLEAVVGAARGQYAR